MFCEHRRRHGNHCHKSTEFLDKLSRAHGCPTELMNGGGGEKPRKPKNFGARFPFFDLGWERVAFFFFPQKKNRNTGREEKGGGRTTKGEEGGGGGE